MIRFSPTTFIANEVIPAGARVKFVAGSAVRVELADAADDLELGTAILHSGKDSYAVDSEVGVQLRAASATRTAIAANGSITAGAPVYRADDGKVSNASVGGSTVCGIALEASGADGDKIEILGLW